MTYEDCIYYEVCKIWNNNIPSEYEGIEFRYDCFKISLRLRKFYSKYRQNNKSIS